MIELPKLQSAPRVTLVEVIYPAGRGRIGLRGSHLPLSWQHTQPPSRSEGDRHWFELRVPAGELIELKLVRNDEDWAQGRNYTVHAGDHLRLWPCFDRTECQLLPTESLEVEGIRVTYEVLLPPSYDEQETRSFPVVYAMDGQSLFTCSTDPFGVWGLEKVLDRMNELGAVEEFILVGVHTAESRLERLSPVPDPDHGGGQGPKFLAVLADRLKPLLDGKFRTKTGREDTALLGSSMGGLFAFIGAWTRPEVFGKAACLSSSFWWSNRYAVRLVQSGRGPSPKPLLYIDSGAALSADEKDLNVRDGFRHTQAMFRALTSHGFVSGVDLHRLVFTGHTHDAASWAARVAIPLQLLFPLPPEVQTPLAELPEPAEPKPPVQPRAEPQTVEESPGVAA